MAGFGAISLPWALALGLLYWVVKETGDLRQGGDFADGWIDAGFVVFGLLYTGQDWWPLALLGAATLDGLLRGKA